MIGLQVRLGGDAGNRLHEWIWTVRPGTAAELRDEWNATGAVLAGRRTVERPSWRSSGVVDTPDATHIRYRVRR